MTSKTGLHYYCYILQMVMKCLRKVFHQQNYILKCVDTERLFQKGVVFNERKQTNPRRD